MNEDKGEMTHPQVPNPQDVETVVASALGKHTQSIEQFPTGIINFVYAVIADDGQELVVRLTLPESKHYFQGAMHWYELLKAKGVPLPTVHYADVEGASQSFPTMIMDRVSGKDLGDVYQELTSEQKKELARRMAAIQKSVAELPMGQGYGYAVSENDPSLKASWIEVLDASLERSRQRIQQAGVISPDAVDRVKAAIYADESYFSTVKPICFLDDITTKNVMIHNGELSGIIDVDSVAYGDPLFTIALTRMSLLAKGYDTDYIDYWLKELHVTAEQRKALDICTAIFCIEFFSEMGHKFNKAAAEPVEDNQVQKLKNILDKLIA